ncbi:MAG: hypothetical protein ACLPVY_03720 [Acidimicrobiia bacterium]
MTAVDLASDAPAANSGHRVRRIIAAVLAVLAGLFVTIGVTSVWVHKTTYQTNAWLATVGPLAKDVRIQAALATWTTSEVNQAVDTEAFFDKFLPPIAQPLAAPLSTAVDSFVAEAAQRFFASPAFVKIWLVANRDAHADIVRVLNGKGAVNVTDGKVRLNLLPVIDQVLQSVNERTHGRFASKISSITSLTPDAARAKLSQALGHPLPPDFGTFTVFEKQQLSAVQRGAQLLDELMYAIVIAALVLLVSAFVVAPDRRRIAIWVGLSTVGFLIAFRATTRASGKHVVSIVLPEYRDATQAVVSRVLTSYLDVTLVALLIFLVVAVVAFLAGPARAAVAIRQRVADMPWLTSHAPGVQIALLAVAMAWILFASLTFGKLLLAALIVGALELALWRLRSGAAASI